MKVEICVIKISHPEGHTTFELEIGNNISIPIHFKEAEQIIKNLDLPLQESVQVGLNKPLKELYY